MGGRSTTAAQVLARIAKGQHGVVAREQLIAAGLTSKEIEGLIASGALIPVHRGVYRVGHAAPSVLATYMAAVLAAGPGALLAGRAAAHLLGITKRRPRRPEVLVTTRRRIPGVIVHQTRDPLPHFERTTWRGIPTTSPARTLVDLAAGADAEELGQAVHEAWIHHRTTPRHVEPVLKRRPNAPGAATLRALMRGDSPILLSKMERRFVRLLRARKRPLPVTNRPAGSKYVDCRWPDHRLTVELDSFTFHNTRRSYEQGRIREREARARGDEFRRFYYADVFEEPEPMLVDLDGLLGYS